MKIGALYSKRKVRRPSPMKMIFIALLALMNISFSHAQDSIRVGVDPFTPPFVMQGGSKQLYGFDIAMMEYICRTMHRSCVFVPLHVKELVPAVAAKKVDAAVSVITVTAERLAQVNFSSPYLLSQARFLGPANLAHQPFNLNLLNGRSIGVAKGTIFPLVINSLGIKTTRIDAYEDYPSLIDALQAGKIDLVLTDSPTAMYWQAQSFKRLSVLGQPFTFGFGFAIAVNRNEPTLLQDINKALEQYQKSEAFKRDYNSYIASF